MSNHNRKVDRDKVIELLGKGFTYDEIAKKHWADIRDCPLDDHPVSRQAIGLIAQRAREAGELSASAPSRSWQKEKKTRKVTR